MTMNYKIKTFLKKIFHSFFGLEKAKDKTEYSKPKHLCKKDYYLPKHVPKQLYLPLYVSPKLLTPNLETIYNIKIEYLVIY